MYIPEEFKVRQYERAKKKVKDLKGFYKHGVSYVFMMLMFTVLYFATDMPFFVVLIIALSWGIGLASHAINVFGIPGKSRDWEDQFILSEMTRYEELLGQKVKELPAALEEDDFLDLSEIRKVKSLEEDTFNDSDFV